MQGALDPQLHVRLAGRATLLGKGGEVVTLRTALRWYERLPLFGRRIVITREVHEEGRPGEVSTRPGGGLRPSPGATPTS